MRTKLGAEFDPDELDVEYDERDDIIEYDGPVPKARMELPGRIKSLWYTTSSNANPMFKVLFEAETAGDRALADYDGCPIWDNITFTPGAAFRYLPFLQIFGLTLRDIKANMDLEEDESRMGRKVLAIRRWRPGSDAARCVVKTKTEVYEEERQVRVAKYMPIDGAASDGEFDEEEFEEERPRRREPVAAGARNGRSTPPRRAASGSRTASGARRSSRYESDDEPF